MSKVLANMSEGAVDRSSQPKGQFPSGAQPTRPPLTVARSNSPPSINPGYMPVTLCLVRFAHPPGNFWIRYCNYQTGGSYLYEGKVFIADVLVDFAKSTFFMSIF